MDLPAESIAVKVLGGMYEIKTQYHVVASITYVLLDAPIFRQQTKADPYPTRMDDLDSAVYYSAWNSCIAEVMTRFPIDLCKSPYLSYAALNTGCRISMESRVLSKDVLWLIGGPERGLLIQSSCRPYKRLPWSGRPFAFASEDRPVSVIAS